MSITRVLRALCPLSLMLLCACGGGGGDSPEISKVKSQGTQVYLKTFDFVFDGSEYSSVDIKLHLSNRPEPTPIYVDKLLMGGVSHSRLQLSERHEATLELLDRGRQETLLKSRLTGINNHSYRLIFAFGEVAKNAYALYSTPLPRISKTPGKVPVFILNTTDISQSQPYEVWIDGKLSLDGVPMRQLSAQLDVAEDFSNSVIELKRDGKLIDRCTNVGGTDNTEQAWESAAWLMIFAPDKECYRHNLSQFPLSNQP